jgi:hypothetical protein
MESFQKTAFSTVRQMKSMILPILAFLCLQAVEADQTQSGFKFGERPKNSIFDPTGVLTPQQQVLIAGPLGKILKAEGIDVMVVILPEIGDAPPEHVAKGFAEKWATTKVNSVVLHVPGHPDSPWILPGDVVGLAVKPEAVSATITEAEKRARAESDDFGKIRAASIEAADAIRYWMGGAFILTERHINQQLANQLAFERRERLLKLAAALAAAGAIPLILGLVFIYLRIRNSGAREFPQIRKVQRLGAPYAGGNHTLTKNH